MKDTQGEIMTVKKNSITDVGPYSIGELLGRGGFGEVREGTNHLSGETVALKFLKRSEIQSMGAVERTANEIQCLATLKHKNIIGLHMHLETPQHIVLAFELMKGGDLHRYMSARGVTASDASLSEEEARHVFHQVLGGVSFAHNHHVIHRDLKLENLLLKENNLNFVKIADFGLSEFSRPGGTLSSRAGTLSFQAPEIFNGGTFRGPPLDIWSLGVILFSLLCGRLPFDQGTEVANQKKSREFIIKTKIGKGQYKIDDHLTSDAKDLIRRMLRVDPNARASIPEIFGHNWMRVHDHSRRASLKDDYARKASLLKIPSAFMAPESFVQVGDGEEIEGEDEKEEKEININLKEDYDSFRPILTPRISSGIDSDSQSGGSLYKDRPLNSAGSCGGGRNGMRKDREISDNLSAYFTADGEPLRSLINDDSLQDSSLDISRTTCTDTSRNNSETTSMKSSNSLNSTRSYSNSGNNSNSNFSTIEMGISNLKLCSAPNSYDDRDNSASSSRVASRRNSKVNSLNESPITTPKIRRSSLDDAIKTDVVKPRLPGLITSRSSIAVDKLVDRLDDLAANLSNEKNTQETGALFKLVPLTKSNASAKYHSDSDESVISNWGDGAPAEALSSSEVKPKRGSMVPGAGTGVYEGQALSSSEVKPKRGSLKGSTGSVRSPVREDSRSIDTPTQSGEEGHRKSGRGRERTARRRDREKERVSMGKGGSSPWSLSTGSSRSSSRQPSARGDRGTYATFC
jgi:serine/threonine protein kinase